MVGVGPHLGWVDQKNLHYSEKEIFKSLAWLIHSALNPQLLRFIQ